MEDIPILKSLLNAGEQQLNRLVEELLGNPLFTEAFMRAVEKGIETKGRVDRNIQTVLGLLNLPSRADITRLVTKLEAVQGSLVNLNLKVDRLLADGGPRRRRAPRGQAPQTNSTSDER